MWGSSVSSIDYQVDGHRVYSVTFAAVYHIPPATVQKIKRNVLAGDKEWVTYKDAKTADTSRDRPTLLMEATA
eukprot:2180122-Pleurochrysis_carterae.AAC.1